MKYIFLYIAIINYTINFTLQLVPKFNLIKIYFS